MPGPEELSERPKMTDAEKEMARVCADPGRIVARRYWPNGYGDDREYEALHVWQARAVLVYQEQRAARPPAPPQVDALAFIEDVADRASSDAVDQQWRVAVCEAVDAGWRVTRPKTS